MTLRSVEVLRRLLLVTAAVCLLATGGVDLVRPPAGSVAPAALSGAGADSVLPAAVSALRSALAAAVPVLGGDVAPPTAGPVLAWHPSHSGGTADDVRRAPGATVDGPDDRGPPRTAGT